MSSCKEEKAGCTAPSCHSAEFRLTATTTPLAPDALRIPGTSGRPRWLNRRQLVMLQMGRIVIPSQALAPRGEGWPQIRALLVGMAGDRQPSSRTEQRGLQPAVSVGMGQAAQRRTEERVLRLGCGMMQKCSRRVAGVLKVEGVQQQRSAK